MSVQVRCPSCGKAASVRELLPGYSLRCPYCKVRFKPAPNTIDQRSAAETVAPAPPPPTQEPIDWLPTTPTVTPTATVSGTIDRLGRFEVRKKLGEGAFGAVYRAFDPQLQREVAVKVPHPQTLASKVALERFQREARATARLRHPHIVPVFDTGEEGGRQFIASEFVPGKTLSARIDDKPQEPRDAARIVRALAEALAYAHREGIVHRDVKPQNVLVDEQDEPHLLDFGLAHCEEGQENQTSEGAILGTPAYMAPEMAKGQQGDPLPASDQYSLGVVLYELLTGRTPFGGPTPVVLFNVINREPPPPHTLNAAVPRDLETICLKAMAKDAERRYADCQEFADDLRRWLDDEPIEARRMSLLERTVRWAKRRPALTGLTALTAVCLIVVGVVATNSVAGLAASRKQIEEAKQSAKLKKAEAEQAAAEARRQAEKADERIWAADIQRLAAKSDFDTAAAQKAGADAATKAAADARIEAEEQDRDNQAQLLAAEVLSGRLGAHDDPARYRAILDRRRAATKGEPDLASVWRFVPPVASGHVFGVHNGAVRSIAMSPDGKYLASAGADKIVRIWDAASGEEVMILERHEQEVSCVTYSPDGCFLASGSDDTTIVLWDTTTGEIISILEGHTGKVTVVAFSPDSNWLASGGTDKTVQLWNVLGGRQPLMLNEFSNEVTSVAFNKDGQILAGASKAGQMKLWDLKSEMKQLTDTLSLWGSGPVAFSDENQTVFTAQFNEIAGWNLATKKSMSTLGGHMDAVASLVFSGDRNSLASLGHDNFVKIWDMTNREERASLPPQPTAITAMALNPDGTVLFTASADRTIRRWDVKELAANVPPRPRVIERKKELPWGTTIPESGARWVFSGDGKQLVVRAESRKIYLWDVETGLVKICLIPELDRVQFSGALAFSDDGKSVVTGAIDTIVKDDIPVTSYPILTWDPPTGRQRTRYQGDFGFVALSPDGKTLAATEEKAVRVWDLVKGGGVVLPGAVGKIVFSGDGKTIASYEGDKITLWDVTTGKERDSIHIADSGSGRFGMGGPGGTRGQESIPFVGFGSDHKTLTMATEDGSIHVWDPGTKKTRRIFQGSRSWNYECAFSRDGRLLARLASDKTIRVLSLNSGHVSAILTGVLGDERKEHIVFLSFSADARTLVCIVRDNTTDGRLIVRLWSLPAL